MTETTESFRPALYYPYIHIRSEDWLKATLLCVPVVKRLIPESYDPEDTGDIAPYAKIACPYGELLQRVPPIASLQIRRNRSFSVRFAITLTPLKRRTTEQKHPRSTSTGFTM